MSDSDAYAELFALADADKDGQVSVQEVSFLRKSGLSNEQLGQIWVLSSEGQMALSKAAFTRALKLVWCAQNGKPLSLESAASVTGVPVFEGVTLKQSSGANSNNTGAGAGGVSVTVDEVKNFRAIFARADTDGDGFVTGLEAKDLLSRSGLDVATLGRIWQLSDVTKDGKLDFVEFGIAMWLVNHCMSGQALPDVLPRSVPATIASGGAAAANGAGDADNDDIVDATRITDIEMNNYDTIFSRADDDHDGFVTGLQAKELFGRSKLPANELAQIWSLADRDRDTRLSRFEFAIAMHLINATLQGVPLPQQLPPALAALGAAAAAPVAAPVPAKPKANYNIDLNVIDAPLAPAPTLSGPPSSFIVPAQPAARAPVAPAPVAFTDNFGSSAFGGAPVMSVSATPAHSTGVQSSSASTADVAALHAEYRREADAVVETNKELLVLQRELDAATADARDLQLRLTAKKKEREANEETKRVYRQQLENLKQQKAQLELILREKLDQFTEEEELLNMLKASLAEKQSDLERVRGEVDESSARLDGLRTQRRDVKEQIAAVDKERKVAQAGGGNNASSSTAAVSAPSSTGSALTSSKPAPTMSMASSASAFGDTDPFGAAPPASTRSTGDVMDAADPFGDSKPTPAVVAKPAPAVDLFGGGGFDAFAAPASTGASSATSNAFAGGAFGDNDPFGSSASDPFASKPAAAASADPFGGSGSISAPVPAKTASVGSSSSAFGASAFGTSDAFGGGAGAAGGSAFGTSDAFGGGADAFGAASAFGAPVSGSSAFGTDPFATAANPFGGSAFGSDEPVDKKKKKKKDTLVASDAAPIAATPAADAPAKEGDGEKKKSKKSADKSDKASTDDAKKPADDKPAASKKDKSERSESKDAPKPDAAAPAPLPPKKKK